MLREAVRRVLPGTDVAAIEGLLRQAQATGHVNAPMNAAARKTFHVLFEGARPVAVCWTRRYPFSLGVDGGLYVVPDRRGLGLARHLTVEARAHLARTGVRRLVVAVHADRPDRLAALVRQGFRVVVARTPSLAGGAVGRCVARALAGLLGMAPAQRPVAVLAGRLAAHGSIATSPSRGRP